MKGSGKDFFRPLPFMDIVLRENPRKGVRIVHLKVYVFREVI